MDTAATEKAKEASAKARSTPLEQFDVADPELFRNDTLWPWFERLRREDPVHLCRESRFGPYWSVTKHHDIIAVDSNHRVFSSDSEIGGITIMDGFQPRQQSSFIALDPPMHDAQRKVIMPMFTPESLATLAPLIRSRAAKILDELPRGETFDFVDSVAVEFTSQMLATLFDFPFDDRRVLPRCLRHDARPAGAGRRRGERGTARRLRCSRSSASSSPLWNERIAIPPARDLISMLGATTDATRRDTTGGLFRQHHPADRRRQRHDPSLDYWRAARAEPESRAEYDKLRADHRLLENTVPEIIRWQSPVALYAPHGAEDIEFGGKPIKKGEKVAMWYVSGNRDEDAIERADEFIIDRERPRQHVSFGFGIHRCLGHAPGRNAIARGLGGDPQALPAYRGRWRAEAHELELRQGL